MIDSNWTGIGDSHLKIPNGSLKNFSRTLYRSQNSLSQDSKSHDQPSDIDTLKTLPVKRQMKQSFAGVQHTFTPIR